MFYTIKIRSQVDFGEGIIPRANGTTVVGGEEYFARMWKQELIDKAPVFDYFFLQTTDTTKPETWEWIVQDVHTFRGGDNPIIGWLVSDHFKEILEQFVIAEPYRFYPAKLKYHDRKLDYYIFNLLWIKLENIISFEELKLNLVQLHTNTPVGKYTEAIHNKDDIDRAKLSLRKEKLDLSLDSVTVTRYFDFLPLYGINSDIIISERLKNAIKQSKIEGVIIEEAPYKITMPELKEQ